MVHAPANPTQPTSEQASEGLRKAIEYFHIMCLGNLTTRNMGAMSQADYETAVLKLTNELLTKIEADKQAHTTELVQNILSELPKSAVLRKLYASAEYNAAYDNGVKDSVDAINRVKEQSK